MPKLNLDNPVFRAMSWLGDMVFLNLLWVLCCLPLVTAGASTAALLTVARRLVSGEICRIGRDFFHAFRLNWRQATKTWLILAAAGVLFAADLLITFQMPGALNNLLRGTSAVLCVVWLTVTGNAFALLARYEYGSVRVIADGALLALKKPLSGMVTVVLALWLPLLLLYDPATALYLLFPWLLVGGSVWALALSATLLPTFRQMEGEKGDS